MMTTIAQDAHLALAYLKAKRRVIQDGFAAEIAWQAARDVTRLTESMFLREAAWVVLCSGFRESIVRSKFDAVSAAFLNWRGAAVIVRKRDQCRDRALRSLAAKRKMEAIVEIAGRVSTLGFAEVLTRLMSNPLGFIRSLPFMGSVTSLHLAKNLGVSAVKPDRHLMRLARAADCGSPLEMCERIAAVIDERIAVVDLVLWRYATIESNYQLLFRPS